MCSFCLRSASEVDKLIAGPGIYICNDCVDRCVGILEAEPAPAPESAAGSGSGGGAIPESDSGPGADPVVMTWAGLDDEAMLTRLPRMATVADQLEESMAAWVGELRTRGVTWQRVGAALGMTRQSAWMRFAEHTHESTVPAGAQR